MVERQRLECESSSWEIAHWFTSSHGTDYFSEERERILAGIETEVACLTAGLEQLFDPSGATGQAGQRHAVAFSQRGRPDLQGRLDRLCSGSRRSLGSKAKSHGSARPSSATYLFDVPEGDFRPRKAERCICRWFVDQPVGSTSCRLSCSARQMRAVSGSTSSFIIRSSRNRFCSPSLHEMSRMIPVSCSKCCKRASPGKVPKTTAIIC